MLFTVDPLTSLDDASLNFEQLQGLTILDLRPDFGTVAFAWTVNQQASDPVTVPHTLGTIPSAYVAMALPDAGTNVAFTIQSAAPATDTALTLQAVADAAQGIGTTLNGAWIAVA